MPKMYRHTLLQIAVGALLLAGVSAPAMAEEADSSTPPPGEAGGKYDTIVVSSQLRDERLTDVPISVSATSGETLQRRFIGSIQNLTEISPSLHYVQAQNDLQAEIRVRGLGTRSFSQTVESSVSFIVDGVVMSRLGQSWIDLIDIDRVEVLRGPQGTLFGKNASAGVIRVITKRPTETFELDSSFLVTDDGEVATQGTVAGPISEKVRGRLTAYYKDRDGYTKNVADYGDRNGSESYGGRMQLDFTPNDALELIFRADYRKQTSTCCPTTFNTIVSPAFAERVAPVVAGPKNMSVNLNGDSINDSEQWGVSLEANYQMGDSTLTSITAYRDWHFINNSDNDQTSLINPPGGISFNINGNDQTNKQFSQELRLASSIGDNVKITVGAYFMNIDIDVLFQHNFVLHDSSGDLPLSVVTFTEDVGSKHYSAFADATWNINDKIAIFGGARAIYERLSFYTVRDIVQNLGARDDKYDYGTRDSDGNYSARAGIQYYLADDIMSYFSYSRGYKGIAFDTFGLFTPAQQEATQTLLPETVDSFEVGIKGSVSGGRLQFGLALFHTTFDNLQQQAQVGDSIDFVQRNVGSVRSKGVELEFTAVPWDNLTLSGSLAYVHAKITDFPGAPCYAGQPSGTESGQCNPATNSQDLSGFPLPYSPKWKIYFGARQDIIIPNVPFDAFIQASVLWQSDVQYSLTQDPLSIQPAYALIDASFGIEYENVIVTVFVKNLADKVFATALGPTPNFVDRGGRSQFFPREAHRFVGISARVRL